MSDNKSIFSLSNIETLLDERVQKGIVRGAGTGFRSLNKKWSLKRGYSSSIFAAAGQGKSIFALEIAMNTAQYQDWKWVIYSPETGNVVEVYLELLWMYHGIKVEQQTKSQLSEAKSFVGNHFFVIDFDANDVMRASASNSEKVKFSSDEKKLTDPTVDMIYREAFKVEDGLDIKLDGVMIDPLTELSMPNPTNVREDVNYGQHISKCIRYSKRHNIHSIMTFHTSRQDVKTFNGKAYSDIPAPSQILNGLMTHRKSYMMISIWVPPAGLPNPQNDGVAFEPFESIITICKVKPKLMGSKGQISLFYDPDRNRYYEKDGNSRTYSSMDANKASDGSESDTSSNQVDLVNLIHSVEPASLDDNPF